MQFAVMIYADPGVAQGMSEAEHAAVAEEFQTLGSDPRIVAMMQLQPRETATTVRVDGGRTLMTDGPFADTKEVLGGLCVIEADNFDEVAELAARVPVTRYGAAVEIRPLVQR